VEEMKNKKVEETKIKKWRKRKLKSAGNKN
jgi:hypothetical protein